ncbi:DoxX family membrane protein [Candidatus Woesearchaeota archaeon]|nr:DoxX family membrane protein [Candidatus Woesearchaeota archaeon]
MKRVSSAFLLRLALAIVFAWFSVNQFVSPEIWTSYIPSFIGKYAPLSLLVYVNAVFELVLAVFLLIGKYTRVFAVLAALHLFSIAVSVGYNDIGVRDFGLFLSAVALAFSENDTTVTVK